MSTTLTATAARSRIDVAAQESAAISAAATAAYLTTLEDRLSRAMTDLELRARDGQDLRLELGVPIEPTDVNEFFRKANVGSGSESVMDHAIAAWISELERPERGFRARIQKDAHAQFVVVDFQGC